MIEKRSFQPDFAGAHSLLMQEKPSKQLLLQFLEAFIRKFEDTVDPEKQAMVMRHKALLTADNKTLAMYCYERGAMGTNSGNRVLREGESIDPVLMSNWIYDAADKWRSIGDYLNQLEDGV